jgi:hypothetical protein
MTTTVCIDERFCGPPGTGNGGYVSGLVARALLAAGHAAAEVTLRAPTPLAQALSLRASEDSASLYTRDGALLLAEASALSHLELEVPAPVSFERAERARERYLGFQAHPYPTCFVCGPARPPELGRGLELYPGAIGDLDDGVTSSSADGPYRQVAAPFQPAEDLCDAQGLLCGEHVWAALDCPSWFGHAAFAQATPKTLLGRLAVQIVRRPAARERCVVTGFGLGQEGRRISCGSALFGADGACIARARATWIALK